MAKQIKPQAIIQRIQGLIQTQQERDYKPGWIFHQMELKVQQAHKNLCHAYRTDIARQAHYIATGQSTIADLSEMLKDEYEIYIEECEMYGLPENER
jgi:hypothetical protein